MIYQLAALALLFVGASAQSVVNPQAFFTKYSEQSVSVYGDQTMFNTPEAAFDTYKSCIQSSIDNDTLPNNVKESLVGWILDWSWNDGDIQGPFRPNEQKKFWICHGTASQTNPYTTNEVNFHALYSPSGDYLQGHFANNFHHTSGNPVNLDYLAGLSPAYGCGCGPAGSNDDDDDEEDASETADSPSTTPCDSTLHTSMGDVYRCNDDGCAEHIDDYQNNKNGFVSTTNPASTYPALTSSNIPAGYTLKPNGIEYVCADDRTWYFPNCCACDERR